MKGDCSCVASCLSLAAVTMLSFAPGPRARAGRRRPRRPRQRRAAAAARRGAPVAPSPNHVWIGGHWAWRGGAHVWVARPLRAAARRRLSLGAGALGQRRRPVDLLRGPLGDEPAHAADLRLRSGPARRRRKRSCSRRRPSRSSRCARPRRSAAPSGSPATGTGTATATCGSAATGRRRAPASVGAEPLAAHAARLGPRPRPLAPRLSHATAAAPRSTSPRESCSCTASRRSSARRNTRASSCTSMPRSDGNGAMSSMPSTWFAAPPLADDHRRAHDGVLEPARLHPLLGLALDREVAGRAPSPRPPTTTAAGAARRPPCAASPSATVVP